MEADKPDEEDKKEVGTPKFNSGIAFLKRIDYLLVGLHRAYEARKMDSIYSFLTTLQIEVLPRTNPAQKKSLQSLAFVFVLPSEPTGLARWRGKEYAEHQIFMEDVARLGKWFTYLNQVIHELKLVMPDKRFDTEGLT